MFSAEMWLIVFLSRWFIRWTWRTRSRRRPCRPWATLTTRSCTGSWWRRVTKEKDRHWGHASSSCRSLWMSSRELELRCVHVWVCVCVLLTSHSWDELISFKTSCVAVISRVNSQWEQQIKATKVPLMSSASLSSCTSCLIYMLCSLPKHQHES